MILITGGSGFFGTNLGRYLAERKQNVLLLSRHTFKAPSFLEPFWGKEVKATQGDILNLPGLLSIIREYSVNSIIHAATPNESEPLYQVIKSALEGTANVLEAARAFNLYRVTFISSVAVYLGLENIRLTEDLNLPSKAYVPGYPVRFTSTFKKACEGVCNLYAREYGISVAVVRISRGYGPCSHWFTPIETMVRGAASGKLVDLSQMYGGSRHNFVHVLDVAQGIALVHLAGTLKHDIYNLGYSTDYSLAQAAQAVKEAIPNAEIRLGTSVTGFEMASGLFDISRIREDLGFTPEYDIQRGIKNTIEWVRHGKYGDR